MTICIIIVIIRSQGLVRDDARGGGKEEAIPAGHPYGEGHQHVCIVIMVVVIIIISSSVIVIMNVMILIIMMDTLTENDIGRLLVVMQKQT